MPILHRKHDGHLAAANMKVLVLEVPEFPLHQDQKRAAVVQAREFPLHEDTETCSFDNMYL